MGSRESLLIFNFGQSAASDETNALAHVQSLAQFTSEGCVISQTKNWSDSAHRARSPLRRLKRSFALLSSNTYPAIRNRTLTRCVTPFAGWLSCGECVAHPCPP